jgi:peptidoglycan/xylan/chitin deacetylase (PgdA/CDA1 family)
VEHKPLTGVAIPTDDLIQLRAARRRSPGEYDRIMMHIKEAVKKTLYYGGYYRLYARCRAPVENRLLVIMYHDLVEDDIAATDWSRWGKPTRSQFAAQVEFLQRHYRVLTVEQAVAEIKSAGRLARPTAAITFDDGYDSVYHIAWPVLRKYDVPATTFLFTDWINRKTTPWWLTLTGMIMKMDFKKTPVAAIEGALGIRFGRKIKTTSNEPKLKWALCSEIEALFRDKPDETVNRLMARLDDLLGGGVPPEVSPLDWEQITEMAAAGMQFGGHTCAHMNFRHIDLRMAEKEIVHSKRQIEKYLARHTTGFAYPYGVDLGAYTKLRPLLKKHGFRYACTASLGWNNHKTDLYLLRRISLPLSKSFAILGRALCLDYVMNNAGPEETSRV